MEQRRRTASKFFPIANPAFALDFTGEYLPPEVTFARNSIGTRVNSAGLVEVIAANQPRFDYDPVTLAVKGLLVEESRTNSLIYSFDYTNATWLKQGTGTGTSPVVVANAAIAPDGTLTADQVTFNTGAGTTLSDQSIISQQRGAGSAVLGAAYTTGIYIKGPAGTKLLSRAVAASGYTEITLTGEWQRVSYTEIAGLDYVYLEIGLRQGTSFGTLNSDITVFLWVSEIQAGSFITSTIPTTDAPVTRAADDVSVIGDDFAKWFNPWAGTFALDFTLLATPTSDATVFSLNDTTTNNRYLNYVPSGTTRSDWLIQKAGVLQANIQLAASYVPATRSQFASTYLTQGTNQAVNGVLGTQDQDISQPTVTQLNIGSSGSGVGGYICGHFRYLNYWQQDAVPEMLKYLASTSYQL